LRNLADADEPQFVIPPTTRGRIPISTPRMAPSSGTPTTAVQPTAYPPTPPRLHIPSPGSRGAPSGSSGRPRTSAGSSRAPWTDWLTSL